MEEDDNGEMIPNKFVQILVSVMDQAATYVDYRNKLCKYVFE